MDQTVLKQYLSQNIIPIKNGRKCVDGRYQSDENSGMIARAGGDLGYVMALLALNKQKNIGFSPEVCFDKLENALKRLGEKFYMHTDEHSDPEINDGINNEPKIGCGHAEKPMHFDLADAYKLHPQDERTLVLYAKIKAHENPEIITMTKLKGVHKEEAVLVNTGTNKTVNSQDLNHMFFVYDKTRDQEFVKKLVNNLEIPHITPEEFQEMLDIQTQATLHNLARDKEIYEINGDQPENVSIKLLGKVE